MKRKFVCIPMAFLTIGCLVGCNNTEKIEADLVVYNNIFTAEDDALVVEAFAVKDSKYIYVGSKEGAQKYINENKTEIIDGNNLGLVIPGATEGHGHYFGGVGLNSQLPGSNKSYDEVLEVLAEQYSNGATQFLSFGWDCYEMATRVNSGENFAEAVELIAPGIPAVLIDNTGHGAICNKTALALAGIDEKTQFRGGTVALDSNGKPSGYVNDQLVFYVVEKAIDSLLTDAQYRNACEYGMSELLKFGYTNAVDALTNMYDPVGLYKALKNMDDNNDLKINIAECYNIRSCDAEIYKDKVDEVVDLVKNYSSSHVHPEYIKLFADGVVEEKTGWMVEPYSDGTNGNIIWTQPELDAITTYANHEGLIIHTHAYGDGANKAMLDSYILSNTINNNQYRNCLAHVRNITEEDAIRAAENNIPVAANLIWHCDYDEDNPARAAIIDRLGETRYFDGYPMKSLMEKGVHVSSSTDAPAAVTTEGSILNVLEVAVTGQEPFYDAAPFATDELLSIEQGLKALTINGAWQLGLENERGSIKVGKYADFVIIDKNILNYQGSQLRNIHEAKILNTYFEGESVYTAPND